MSIIMESIAMHVNRTKPGVALLFEGLKPATKDIDLILKEEDEFNFFNKSLEAMIFKEENPSAIYKKMELNKIMVRDDYRIDAFLKKVCKKFALSDDIVKRSDKILDLKNISVNKCSNEDIFLFKSMTERSGDLDDCIELVKKGLNWNEIKDEMINQIKTNGEDEWITWIGERLNELIGRGLTIPIMKDIDKIIDEYFDNLEKKQFSKNI